MSSDSLWQLRKTCLSAIQQCEQAEKAVKQIQDTASRYRQASLANLRHKDTQIRQQAEKTLVEIRNMVNQEDNLMTELKI